MQNRKMKLPVVNCYTIMTTPKQYPFLPLRTPPLPNPNNRSLSLTLPILKCDDTKKKNLIDSPEFHHCSSTTKNRLLALHMAATDTRDDAVTRGTSDKQVRAWSRWRQLLQSIDLHNDEYLDRLK